MRTTTSRTSTLATRASLVVAFAFFAGPLRAALITSGTYDELASQANQVDHEATGNTIALADFKALVSDAWNNDRGGVIHFDDQTAGTILADADADEPNPDDGVHEAPGVNTDEGFDTTHGASGTQSIRVRMGDLTDRTDDTGASPDNWEGSWGIRDSTSDRTPISGSNKLSGLTDWDFRFSMPLRAVGITVLSRNDNVGDDVTVTLFYDDNSSEEVETDFFIDNTNGEDDTFFGYQAQDSRLITGIVLDIDEGETGGQGIGEPDYTHVDDLAFVIPEPASFALLFLGGIALLRRRRRR